MKKWVEEERDMSWKGGEKKGNVRIRKEWEKGRERREGRKRGKVRYKREGRLD